MADDNNETAGGSPKKAQPPPRPPQPKGEVVAPPFKWVTKGEKGVGIEPAIAVDSTSE